jgi:hypothetical protein
MRAACYFPRDFFFCFFTFTLTIGAFVSVPREPGLGAPCFLDFFAIPISSIEGEWHRTIPRYRPCAVGLSRRSQKGVGRSDWPCRQNTG